MSPRFGTVHLPTSALPLPRSDATEGADYRLDTMIHISQSPEENERGSARPRVWVKKRGLREPVTCPEPMVCGVGTHRCQTPLRFPASKEPFLFVFLKKPPSPTLLTHTHVEIEQAGLLTRPSWGDWCRNPPRVYSSLSTSPEQFPSRTGFGRVTGPAWANRISPNVTQMKSVRVLVHWGSSVLSCWVDASREEAWAGPQ